MKWPFSNYFINGIVVVISRLVLCFGCRLVRNEEEVEELGLVSSRGS
jgi:hypothetical protein